MIGWTRTFGIGLALAIAGIVAACQAGHACYAGDFEACTCADGRAGFAACDVAKDAYGDCGSCGQVPGLPDAGPTGGAGGSSASGGSGGETTTTTTKLGFMETCVTDDDCESGICHVYGAKGPKCTTHCQTAADCPPPSPGCNLMGFCKAP